MLSCSKRVGWPVIDMPRINLGGTLRIRGFVGHSKPLDAVRDIISLVDGHLRMGINKGVVTAMGLSRLFGTRSPGRKDGRINW